MEKCNLLARIYGTTIDRLVSTDRIDGIGLLPPAPVGKNIWGSVTVNDRGQIVIPKDARDKFDLTVGSRLIVGSDECGIDLFPADTFEEIVRRGMKGMPERGNE